MSPLRKEHLGAHLVFAGLLPSAAVAPPRGAASAPADALEQTIHLGFGLEKGDVRHLWAFQSQLH